MKKAVMEMSKYGNNLFITKIFLFFEYFLTLYQVVLKERAIKGQTIIQTSIFENNQSSNV